MCATDMLEILMGIPLQGYLPNEHGSSLCGTPQSNHRGTSDYSQLSTNDVCKCCINEYTHSHTVNMLCLLPIGTTDGRAILIHRITHIILSEISCLLPVKRAPKRAPIENTETIRPCIWINSA